MLLMKPPDKIAGQKVDTDFKKWMRFGVLLDSPLLYTEKVIIGCKNMFKRPPNDPGAAFAALLDFYNCGESTEGPAPPERLLDWERDSRLIWGDFRLHYGMDIDKEKICLLYTSRCV